MTADLIAGERENGNPYLTDLAPKVGAIKRPKPLFMGKGAVNQIVIY